ncbi:MAG: class I adenylate-forming enzyme family protein [bacterium]|nr:class I adenylate-forming enzyme family protein [bacterium]
MKNLYEHILSLATQYPEKEALLSCDSHGNAQKTYTYKDVQEIVERTGVWFERELGLCAGDIVALALPNSVEFLLISWTAWAMGIVTVPLDIKRDTQKEHLYKVQLAKVTLLITKEDIFSPIDFESIKEHVKVVNINESLQHNEVIIAPAWEKGTAHSAMILFTSGTTAAPKGAELTLENILTNADGIYNWLQIRKEDRFCVLLPLHHINSTTFCLASLLAGASIVVPPTYSHSRFWEQLAKTKCTFTSIVPTICYDQLSREKEFNEVKKELKISRIQIGSAPVVPADAKEFMEKFGIPLFQGYGQTETALRVTGVPMGLEKGMHEILLAKNSIGKEMKWADVQIMDSKGNILKEGKEGEVAVKGPAIMKGYVQNTDENKKAFLNGYFLTGDLGYYKNIGEERYFFLKGRIKEIIIKGGINLSPVSIEERLRKMCKDISEVYVIGVDDRRFGEEVGAVVCFKKSEKSVEKLKTQLAHQIISSKEFPDFEKPKYIGVIEEFFIPRTTTGKVQRAVIKKNMAESALEQITLVAKNNEYIFFRLIKDEKRYMKQAFTLFNYCWQPMRIDEDTFASHVENGIVIIGVDTKDNVAGLISFIKTSLKEEEIAKLSYQELTGDVTLKTNQEEGDKIVCVSICSNSAKPQEIAEGSTPKSPLPEEMEAYLLAGADLVYNFHQKPKGGAEGATLVALLPQARPEDTLSLGYCMLLKYPELVLSKVIEPDGKASLAVQLMESAMHVASHMDILKVYAFSRPSGAYKYFTQK